MSKHVHVVVIVVVAMFIVFLAALASSVLAGEEPGAGAPGAPVQAGQDGPVTSLGAVETSWMRMPLYFIENQGQLDEPVAYYVQGQDKTLYFTPQGVTFVLHESAPAVPPVIASEAKQSPAIESPRLPRLRLVMTEDDAQPPDSAPQRWVVKLDFVGANPGVLPVGQDETGAVISYFKGRPEEWKTGLKTYSRIVYRDLWPGIDLQYSGTVDELKYQFVVQPGADPGHIQLAYRGASDVSVNGSGQLEVTTPAGEFHDGRPYGYQEIDGQKLEVELSYEPLGVDRERHLYGFQAGAYDPSLPLVLDPVVLVYCGFIGGSEYDYAGDIAVDADGHAYVVGCTYSISTTFPVGVGPDLTHNGGVDAFVAKVKVDGSALNYCGYIGGSELDSGTAIAVDALGQAYVTGPTESSESQGFPVISGPDLSYNGSDDAFVAKVSATGKSLIYCGYIGGSGYDVGYGIAVDSEGYAYVAGLAGPSSRPRFPVTVGPDLTYNGGVYDAFVAKVNTRGTELEYCGYIGGSGFDTGYGIAVDAAGQAYVTGDTTSNETEDFPVAVGPDVTHNGATDAFVAKVVSDGAALEYCGYIGGRHDDEPYGIAVDSIGQAYVTGYTNSSETDGFPVTVGPDLTYNSVHSPDDAFVAKVRADGSGLAYCGYIGGGGSDEGRDIAVDSEGCAHVVGGTESSESHDFPVTVGPDLTHNGGGGDAFVAKVNPGGRALVYCGYIGGSSNESGSGIAVDAWGAAYVSGFTTGTDDGTFPVVTGPDTTFNGGAGDAFVAKVKWNYAPLLGDVLPSSGSGPTGVTEHFRTTWSDPNGRDDLKQCYFHIGSTPTLAGNVTLLYQARKNKLWMLADDGSTWTGGFAPGSANTLENSQARVHCALTTIGGSGDTLSVTWAIEFKPGYGGTKKTGLMCKDIHKARAKGAWKGTWRITL